ncbi:MAG: glycosyltransferase [Deltaproteobacteria bacterium]|nr:glycosyltransferase [Deltaproteobacteria bacterium]MBW2072043.1 glycosyltransferase [Deltaproteobacteria bacterium]
MARRPTYNILMYSHDTYGLGHIRRTLAIATQLREPNVNILILTGSPIVGRFDFPSQIDFVRIPGMIKMTNEEYLPLSIKIDAKHALNIRQTIITATAKAFQPDLFIVDKAPLGLKREVIPTLKWMQRCQPRTRTVLGLRDIMDDAESTRRDWEEKGVYQVLQRYYSEIWVYGKQEYYDPIREYQLPESIARKTLFTGYIARAVTKPATLREVRREQGLGAGDKLVVVTTGGGGDGYALTDTYLTMLENEAELPYYKTVIITGPFMPKKKRNEIARRARRLQIRFYRFYRRMERIIGAADLVVSMGGYNTVCELLSQKKLSLIVPREQPRREQLIRAQILHKHQLVDYIPWRQLEPDLLRQKVHSLLERPEPYLQAIEDFRFTAIEVIRRRLAEFRLLNNEGDQQRNSCSMTASA